MKRDVLVTSLVKQKPVQTPAVDRSADGLRRLEHLESQIAKLSELVREHAEDVDRLVRIVAIRYGPAPTKITQQANQLGLSFP